MKGDRIPIKEPYPVSGFRVDEEVKKYLRNMKYDTGLSYNLIFHELINLHKEQSGRENETNGETGGEASKEIQEIL